MFTSTFDLISVFNSGMLILNFVSAKVVVKHSFYRKDDGIAKLLDMLCDWVLWCYDEKHLETFDYFAAAANSIAKYTKCFVNPVWNGCEKINLIDSSLLLFRNTSGCCLFKMQIENQNDELLPVSPHNL